MKISFLPTCSLIKLLINILNIFESKGKYHFRVPSKRMNTFTNGNVQFYVKLLAFWYKESDDAPGAVCGKIKPVSTPVGIKCTLQNFHQAPIQDYRQ